MTEGSRFFIIVQARRGSTRLPDKVLMEACGVSLLERQIERMLRAQVFAGASPQAELIVATTEEAQDDVIFEICERREWTCFRGHSTDLLDRHYQAALKLGAKPDDAVVKIPSDCPLIDPSVIDRVTGFYRDAQARGERLDFVSNLHPATYPDGNDVEVMRFEALETAWKNATLPLEREHTTPYIWERAGQGDGQFKIANLSWESGLDYSMSHRWTLDYAEDYAFISRVYAELYPENPAFSLGDILALLDAKPEIAALNQSYAGVNWYRNHLGELKTIQASQTRQESPKMEANQNAGTIPAKHADLEAQALKVREHVIRMATDGGCFLGASLSCVDLVVFLYNRFLNVNQGNLKDPNRDYLFLSKGHDVPALYGTWAEMGWMPKERLANHLSTNDWIYWHPNTKIPGVEFHSGSLGHLLSVAVGVAMDCKMRGATNKIVVITGDGELNEGSNWEALLVAQAYKLDNLIVVVDRNEFQANMRTEDLIPLEPLRDKFEAFGAKAFQIDGHDFDALEGAFKRLPIQEGKPNVVIARTVRGRGLPSIEKRADRWFCNFTHTEIDGLLQELHGQAKANIQSETIVAR